LLASLKSPCTQQAKACPNNCGELTELELMHSAALWFSE